jgi:MFS family permease
VSATHTVKPPPPWLFAISAIPYGVSGGFTAIIMPYMADHAGLKLDQIGWFVTLLFIPPIVQFLYAPIVDIGLQRKHWLILLSCLGAACFFGALQMRLPDDTVPFLALAVAGTLISGLTGSCNGGLMAQLVPDHQRGQASAALNVGNLSGSALSGALVAWMIGNDFNLQLIGIVLVVMMAAPSFAILMIVEPVRVKRTVTELFGGMLRDVGKVLFSRIGITGVLLCLSPVGTAALTNYFSAMGSKYGASTGEIALLTGPASALLNAAGAVIGGLMCDRINRRAVYLLAGLLTAMCGLGMMLSPRTEMTFVVGGTVYALITGLSYAAFTATVLETIGKGGQNASTQYALFVAAGNAAIAYVGLADTRFSNQYGVEGVCGSDAALNIAGVVVLGGVFAAMGYFKSLRHTPEVPPVDIETEQPAPSDPRPY